MNATTTVVSTSINDAPSLGSLSVSVPSGSPPGSTVASAAGTDPDTGDPLSYAIVGGNTGGAFAIDVSSGLITVANPAAVDANPSFSLAVQVTDGQAASALGSVAVSVTPPGTTTPVTPPVTTPGPTPDPAPLPLPAPNPTATPSPAPAPPKLAPLPAPGPVPVVPASAPVRVSAKQPELPPVSAPSRVVLERAESPGQPRATVMERVAQQAREETEPVELFQVDDAMWEALNELTEQMSEEEFDLLMASAQAATLTTFAGVLTWLLRAGSMVGSLLSTLPLWARMDPLAVLDAQRKEEKDEAGDDFDDEDAELAGLIPDPEPAAPPRTEELREGPSGQDPA